MSLIGFTEGFNVEFQGERKKSIQKYLFIPTRNDSKIFFLITRMELPMEQGKFSGVGWEEKKQPRCSALEMLNLGCQSPSEDVKEVVGLMNLEFGLGEIYS